MATEVDPPYEHHEYFPKDLKMPEYNDENPHPEFGKNPNIRNVQGHTEYPKWVKNKDGERVLVENPTEEAEATGVKADAAKGWGKSK